METHDFSIACREEDQSWLQNMTNKKIRRSLLAAGFLGRFEFWKNLSVCQVADQAFFNKVVFLTFLDFRSFFHYFPHLTHFSSLEGHFYRFKFWSLCCSSPPCCPFIFFFPVPIWTLLGKYLQAGAHSRISSSFSFRSIGFCSPLTCLKREQTGFYWTEVIKPSLSPPFSLAITQIYLPALTAEEKQALKWCYFVHA